jgi:hypothetical protein
MNGGWMMDAILGELFGCKSLFFGMKYLDELWANCSNKLALFWTCTIASLKNGHQNGYNSLAHLPLKSQRKPPKFLVSTLLLPPI